MHTQSNVAQQGIDAYPVVKAARMATLEGGLGWLIRQLRQTMTAAAQFFPIIGQQLRQEFLDEVKAQASQKGYAALEVNSGLIDMLLIKRQERIVVMARSREWFAGDHTQLVMGLMQADAAWVLDRRALLSHMGPAPLARPCLIKTIERALEYGSCAPSAGGATAHPASSVVRG
jgi:hypothetical protein